MKKMLPIIILIVAGVLIRVFVNVDIDGMLQTVFLVSRDRAQAITVLIIGILVYIYIQFKKYRDNDPVKYIRMTKIIFVVLLLSLLTMVIPFGYRLGYIIMFACFISFWVGFLLPSDGGRAYYSYICLLITFSGIMNVGFGPIVFSMVMIVGISAIGFLFGFTRDVSKNYHNP